MAKCFQRTSNFVYYFLFYLILILVFYFIEQGSVPVLQMTFYANLANYHRHLLWQVEPPECLLDDGKVPGMDWFSISILQLFLGLPSLPNSLCYPVWLNAATGGDDGLWPDVPYSPGQLHGWETCGLGRISVTKVSLLGTLYSCICIWRLHWDMGGGLMNYWAPYEENNKKVGAVVESNACPKFRKEVSKSDRKNSDVICRCPFSAAL